MVLLLICITETLKTSIIINNLRKLVRERRERPGGQRGRGDIIMMGLMTNHLHILRQSSPLPSNHTCRVRTATYHQPQHKGHIIIQRGNLSGVSSIM